MTAVGLLSHWPGDMVTTYLPSRRFSFSIWTSETSPILYLAHIYFLSIYTLLSVISTHPTESEYLHTFITTYLNLL